MSPDKTATAVSIAMATSNGANFIRAQLDSLAAQTHLPAELVITDDCSTDDTSAIVGEFAATAPFPVHFHRNPVRLGFRGNFLRAASLCTGALIAFCDQDDIWDPTKLATVCALFASEPDVLLVHHNANVLVGDRCAGLLVPPDRHPDSFAPLTAHPWLVSHGFTQTFRRDLLAFHDLWEYSIDASIPGPRDLWELNAQGNMAAQEETAAPEVPANGSAERMTHDQWFLFLASVFGWIRWIRTPLADYRQHGRNTYGVFSVETLGERARLWLEDRSPVYARCREAALCRANMLDACLPRLSNPLWQQRALTASARYRKLAALYEERLCIYETIGFVGRLHAFRRLRGEDAYNYRGDWTFHAKGACKDIVLGVLGGPLLRRYGYLAAWGDVTCAAVAHD